MNSLEQQLASLLTEAPGEPPNTIDPDAVLARAPRRRRWVAPALAAAAVVAIAVPIAVFVVRDSGTTPNKPTASGSEAPPPPTTVADPKAAAIDRITAALEAAPLPPGAVRSETELPPVHDGYVTSEALNQVRRTAWFTAPGGVDAAIDYLEGNPPDLMRLQSSGNSSPSGGQDVEFATEPVNPGTYAVELDYFVAPYAGGIALRIDAWTSWAANRPAWSFVPADATSVDITVVRGALNPDHPEFGGAPTVQRTLTGDALAQLADAVNALPPRAPEGAHSCPAILVNARDLAVFHAPAGDIRMMHNGGGCAFNATITAAAGGEDVYVSGGDFTDALLSALGLPKGYGFGVH